MHYSIEECNFVGNYLNDCHDKNGGAIYLANSNGKIKKSNFLNNYITETKMIIDSF